MPIPDSDLENRFTYHHPKGFQPDKYAQIRLAAKSFAKLINAVCPDGREQSLAITKTEEAMMWANAAIARGD